MAGLWRNDSETPEGKYPIVLRRDGAVVTKPYFVLLDCDPGFVDAMTAYADKHKELGSDPAFVQQIYDWVNDVINDTNAGDITPGDPDAPRHRTDDPVVIAWARSVHSKSA